MATGLHKMSRTHRTDQTLSSLSRSSGGADISQRPPACITYLAHLGHIIPPCSLSTVDLRDRRMPMAIGLRRVPRTHNTYQILVARSRSVGGRYTPTSIRLHHVSCTHRTDQNPISGSRSIGTDASQRPSDFTKCPTHIGENRSLLHDLDLSGGTYIPTAVGLHQMSCTHRTN